MNLVPQRNENCVENPVQTNNAYYRQHRCPNSASAMSHLNYITDPSLRADEVSTVTPSRFREIRPEETREANAHQFYESRRKSQET